MINEIDTILKKFRDKFATEETMGGDVLIADFIDGKALVAKDIEDFISSSLKALLESLDKELEKEKIYDIDDTPRSAPNMHGFNEGLNLAQERIRAKLK